MTCIRLVPLACLLAACACKVPSELPPEQEESPQPQPQLTGGCNNEHLEGSCTFLLLHAEKPTDSDPEGTTVYRVTYTVKEGETEVELDWLCLRIPSDREKDLRELLESRSPVPCTAYIVRPPCAPQATSVTPKIEWPDWVSDARCY